MCTTEVLYFNEGKRHEVISVHDINTYTLPNGYTVELTGFTHIR